MGKMVSIANKASLETENALRNRRHKSLFKMKTPTHRQNYDVDDDDEDGDGVFFYSVHAYTQLKEPIMAKKHISGRGDFPLCQRRFLN